MSEFDDAMGEMQAEAFGVFGTTPFQLGGATFAGVFDQFTSERSLQIGGFTGSYNATLLCDLAQFSPKFAAPIERTLDGQRVTILGRTLRIATAALDGSSITLGLVNPDGGGKK